MTSTAAARRRAPARRALLAVVAAATLAAGCTAGDAGTPSAGSSPGPAGAPAASAEPTPAQTLTGAKRAAGQALPAEASGWKLDRRQAGGGATSGFYTNPATPGQVVVTLTPVALTTDALATALSGAHDVAGATCGTLVGAAGPACYLPLAGGNLRVTGPLPEADLAALATAVVAGFR